MLEHVHGYTPDEKQCPECGPHTYEVRVRTGGRWVRTSAWIFRSWSGERQLDGEIYNGPVYYMGATEVARP